MTNKPRGRPRTYDPDDILVRALEAFWKGGYAGTSLDTLCEATGLNRPSLYAGLGDKRTIYLKTMERFRSMTAQRIDAALSSQTNGDPAAEALERYLHAVIDIYLPQDKGSVSGCAVMSTATAEALSDPGIRQMLATVLQQMEQQLVTYLRQSKDAGKLAKNTDIDALAFILASVTQSVGLRARAGQTKQDIERMVTPIVKALGLQSAPARVV